MSTKSNIDDFVILISPFIDFAEKDNDNLVRQISGFDNHYKFQNKQIPIYEVHTKKDFIILINHKKWATYYQKNPLAEDEPEDLRYKNFYFDLRFFSEDPNLLKEILEKSPDWLISMGNLSQQESFLKKKGIIKIFPHYEFRIHDEFEGYLFKLIDN